MWKREPWRVSTAPHASGSAMLTTPSQPFPGSSLPRFRTTSMALNHPSGSQRKRKVTDTWHSSMCYCAEKMMARSALLCTARPHTPTSTCPSGPTIQPAHKVAVVKTLMIRADNLSSSGAEQTEEEKQVTDALIGNGYLSDFIRKHTIPSRRREKVENERPKTTLTLPYISGLSEAIRRILNPLEVKVVFCPLRNLRQMLVYPKDPATAEEHKGVIYSIPCQDCTNVYIGQTGRCLKQRLSEHRRALRNGGARVHNWACSRPQPV